MNVTATRIVLALSCGLAGAAPAMSANEMRFSDLEARIAAVEQKTTAIPGLKPAAFLSDGDPIDAVAPNDAHRPSADEELSSPSSYSGKSSNSRSSCSSCTSVAAAATAHLRVRQRCARAAVRARPDVATARMDSAARTRAATTRKSICCSSART